MNIKLYNADVSPIYIEYDNENILLYPNESKILETNQNGEIIIGLRHYKNDKFNMIWYVMNEIFTLEQMRTILVVDGLYKIKIKNCGDIVKIRNHEYVFNKNMSYDTFVFNMEAYNIQTQHLNVRNGCNLIKKAKFLYLFGGLKTLFPLFTIALIATLLSFLTNEISLKDIVLTVVLCFIVIIGFINYINSIKLLKNAIDEEQIIKYMSSNRKEYRKFTDNLVEKQLYKDSNNEYFK